MTIRHHISDALLMAYSAGEVDEAFALVIATHLSMCDECRSRAGAFDAIGGVMVDGIEAAPIAEDSLQACLARIDAMGMAPPPKPVRRGSVPQPLVDYIGGDLAAIQWRPIGMGVKQAVLLSGQGASARMLMIPAGQVMPDHGHRGLELTMVLRGAFRDGADRFGPGDVEIAGEDTKHTPAAEPGEDCICLAAVDGKLQFKGLLPRLAQPFFGI
ncbi:MAG: ChrR family anti-sigma-E factor [Gemmobacter sp.]